MNNPTQTLEQLDSTLDTVEDIIRELPLSIADQHKCIDMIYALYETAEASVESALAEAASEVDTPA